MINILDTVRQWRARNVAIDALSRMDDRMLADIGIRSRSDISRYVRGLK
ncbi:MAG: DUF1127 domain-containing protein [Alphaproteobacteria bacterium]